MAHVFIVGFMGAGKSTVGRIVAERLDMPFIDLDEEAERSTGRTISQVFAEGGESSFRDLEHAVLVRVAAGPDAVVACGGGVVLREDNRRLLAERGTVVLLEVDADEAIARVGNAGGRPLLAGKLASTAAKLLKERRHLYEQVADASVRTDGRPPAAIAAEVIEAVRATSAGARTIRVETGERGYDVVVGPGLLGELGERVRGVSSAARVAVVTDTNVGPLLGGRVIASLRGAGFEVHPLVIEAGEPSKDWATAGALIGEMARERLDRDDLVLALGGGVVGDLAGFCASAFLRGVDFVQVPTTLLAQVDSAIGGKTGVDLAEGKNLAGAFWQPLLVLADTDVLASVPETEWRSGLAEVAKAALLDGEAALARLESEAAAVLARESDAVSESVRMAVRLKAHVVTADEREAGLRESLNYGHTFGHAIEKVAGYGVVPHGLAVAEGIRFAARLGERVVGATADFTARQDSLLDALGLPPLEQRWDAEQLLDAMRSDKKARKGRVRFVLLDGPGSCQLREVDDRLLADAVDAWVGTGTGKEVR